VFVKDTSQISVARYKTTKYLAKNTDEDKENNALQNNAFQNSDLLNREVLYT